MKGLEIISKKKSARKKKLRRMRKHEFEHQPEASLSRKNQIKKANYAQKALKREKKFGV